MKLAHNYYVYILHCSDGFYYVGVTNDLNRRFQEHNAGINPFCFTYKRRPVVLKYFEEYTEVLQAIQREKQLKGWSRAKKEALFAQDFDALKELARCTEAKGGKALVMTLSSHAATLRQAQGDNARQNPLLHKN